MTITVSDIMTIDVVSLSPQSSLRDAHQTTRRMGIRHLPIVDTKTSALVAILTQKSMIAKVVSLLTQYGSETLEQKEQETNVMELAVTDYDAVAPGDSVAKIAPFFLQNKHGCLPVLDENQQLVGIVTSSDFVKLAIQLLQDQ